MKGYIFTIALALLSTIATSQVGVGTNTIDPSAMLQVESSDKGFLPPSMTEVQRDAISSPAEGLLIYNETTNNFEFSDGTNWISLADGSTLAAINTASASGTGDVGIGITTPDATAAVDVVSTTRGFLPPRVTTTERDAIGSPAKGLLVYNESTNDLEYSDGTNWISLKDGSTLAAVSTGTGSGSGVGIGTNTPDASAALHVESSTRGFLPPRMNTASRNAIGAPAAGIIIYNSDEKCLEVYNATTWYNMCNPLITDLDCDNATLSGSLTENEDATGENFVVDYTNGNGKSYPSQSVASTGVMGLTATLSAGTLASGNGSVTYTISGTPTGSGTASFAISLGGQSCTVNLTVDALPATITALGGPGCTGEGVITETLVVGEDVSTNGINMILYAQVATPGDWSYTATANVSEGNDNTGVTFSGSGTFTSAGCHRIELAGSGVPTSQKITFLGRWDTNTSPNGVARTNIIQASQTGIPAGIVLGNLTEFYHSVNDSDYAPFTDPTAPADTTTVNADGTNESITLDRQGVISGRSIDIPVVSNTIPPGSSVVIHEQRKTITIPAEYTEDGVPGEVTLKLGRTTVRDVDFTPSNGLFITAELIVPRNINLKKLDVNSGLGTDFLGLLVGSIEFPASSSGTTATLELRDHPGVPGNADATNLYLPVMSLNERIWLNNNIGANYTEVGHAAFNPQQQATPNGIDPNAYGDYFQWSRRPDGHEDPNSLVETSQLTGTQPNSDRFVSCIPCNAKWTTSYSTVGQWSGVTAANNPCPSGFRVPNEAEFNAETDTWLNIDAVYAGGNTKLRLPSNGFRRNDASFSRVGENVNLWSSDGENYGNIPVPSESGTRGFGLDLSPTGFSTTNRPGSVLRIQGEIWGYGVRCIKD